MARVGTGAFARPAEREALEWFMANNSKHTSLGIALGAALGAVLGVLAGHVAIWLAVGVAIGMVLGASLRRVEGHCPECAAIHQKHERRRQLRG
ncbi:MAG TPA: hypothetical protein VNY51_00570 [Candidatus Dormibacteraeota bacterium]|nr:hypothetical protein [Candidatus Dormibacteraeota bacterium]